MEMMYKKAIMSVIELPLLIFLISSTIIYFNIVAQPSEVDYKVKFDSVFSAVAYNDNFRSIYLNEDLSSVIVTQNWDAVYDALNISVGDFEIVLSNLTTSKIIYSCQSENKKYYSERIIAIENNLNYEFRILKFGVCY